MAYTVRLLGPEDVPAYRALRLEGLALEPAAFASSLEDEQAQADDEWRTRLARGGTWSESISSRRPAAPARRTCCSPKF